MVMLRRVMASMMRRFWSSLARRQYRPVVGFFHHRGDVIPPALETEGVGGHHDIEQAAVERLDDAPGRRFGGVGR